MSASQSSPARILALSLLTGVLLTLASCGGDGSGGSSGGRSNPDRPPAPSPSTARIEHVPFYVLDFDEPIAVPVNVSGATMSTTSLTATASPSTAVEIEIDNAHDLVNLTRLRAGLVTITVAGTVPHASGPSRTLPPVTFDVDESSAPTTHLRLVANYLTEVRSNPPLYDEEIQADVGDYPGQLADQPVPNVDLSDVEPRHPLKWHPILTQVAQAKCEDMIERNYYRGT